MNRIDSLDWLRGILAFAIMLFHLTLWQLGSPETSSLLGRLGIYGVSMFFVLSGLSMAIVYHRYIDGLRSSLHFLIRRICRIWPLLWVTVAYAVASWLAAGEHPDWYAVAMNLSTAFGFVEPDLYISKGAWSVGNEMVYYALTPIIIWTFNKSTTLGNMLTGVTVVIGILFSSYILRADISLGPQWHTYINPFNNLFLYCAGIALFYNARNWQPRAAASLALFAIPLVLLLFYPAQGDLIHIVTGVARVVFCSASVALVLAFYKNAFAIPRAVSACLTQLGVMTYGVYLLHPIVYEVILSGSTKLRLEPDPYMLFTLVIITTIVAAQASFSLLEEPFIRLGKQLTSRPKNASSPVTPMARP